MLDFRGFVKAERKRIHVVIQREIQYVFAHFSAFERLGTLESPRFEMFGAHGRDVRIHAVLLLDEDKARTARKRHVRHIAKGRIRRFESDQGRVRSESYSSARRIAPKHRYALVCRNRYRLRHAVKPALVRRIRESVKVERFARNIEVAYSVRDDSCRRHIFIDVEYRFFCFFF